MTIGSILGLRVTVPLVRPAGAVAASLNVVRAQSGAARHDLLVPEIRFVCVVSTRYDSRATTAGTIASRQEDSFVRYSEYSLLLESESLCDDGSSRGSEHTGFGAESVAFAGNIRRFITYVTNQP